MKEIDKVLDDNEKVFWEGRPRLWPYLLTGAIPLFIFGIIWNAFLVPFVFVGWFMPKFTASTLPDMALQGVNTVGPTKSMITAFFVGWNLFLVPFVLIGLWMLFGTPIYKWLLHKHLYYAITNKRLIIQKGVIGRDFEYVDFDQITNAEVRVGFWDKMVGKSTGSIYLSTAASSSISQRQQALPLPYTLSNIDRPYEVFKFFKKVSHDVKTDIEYPNKLRPAENPGYQTNYEPKK